MSLVVFLAVLAAAAVHAGWNALVKSSDDKAAATALVGIGAGLIGLAALPFVDAPAPPARPWLLASIVFQVGYMALLVKTYRHADLGIAYPLMRGVAPLLVAASSLVVFGERLASWAWVGVGLISLGVVGLVFASRGRTRGAWLALLNACFIAGYTLLDGRGVRLSGTPLGYAAWGAILTAIPLLAWALIARGRRLVEDLRGRLLYGLVGGAATMLSYGVALWAMTRAPVATVAALRETSIVFALLIGRHLFAEHLGAVRIAAVGVVVAGVLALRLGH